MSRKIIIGTRASRLAVVQAEMVASCLQKLGCEVELKKMSTKGDEILDRSLMEIGGKGLFLKELEDALLRGSVDIAVHSMKDVPYELPDRLQIGAILPREDPGDAFISRSGKPLAELPEGSVIGTSSLRRLVQLKKNYPQFEYKTLRGNVQTRIGKMESGEFDGIVLACAGLKRLGLAERITQTLNIVAAVGQGAIGIECRGNDMSLMEILTTLNDPKTEREVHLEREFMRILKGSCQTPVGCHVVQSLKSPNAFELTCFVAETDGSHAKTGELSGDFSEGSLMIEQWIQSWRTHRY